MNRGTYRTPQTETTEGSRKARWALAKAPLSASLATMLISLSSSAAHAVALTGTDPIGESSFTLGVRWNDGLPPSSGKVYETAGFNIRTPDGAASATFAGDSLTITAGSNLGLKAADGGVVTIANSVNNPGGLILDGGRINAASGNSATILRGLITLQSGSFVRPNDATREVLIDSDIVDAFGSTAGITIESGNSTGGVVQFNSSANTYSGETVVQNGTILRMGTANAMPNDPGDGDLIIDSGGNFELAGNDTVIQGLAGGGSVTNANASAATLTIQGDQDAITTHDGFSGSISNGTGSAALSVIKTGSSTTQTFSGNNSYTGGATIEEGTLVAASNTALGTGAVTVTNTGTGDGALGLSGGVTTSNPVTLDGRTATTAHIDSTDGSNALSGDLTLQGAGNFNVTSSGTDSGDLLTVSGDITDADDNDHTLNLGGAGDGTVSGAVTLNGTGTDVLQKSGTGKWEITGGVQSDQIAVGGGQLLLSGGATTGTVAITGGELNLSSTLTTTGDVTIDSGAMLSQIGGSYIDATDQVGGYVVNGTLNLNGEDGSVNWLSGAGIVDSVAAVDPILTVGNSDGDDATFTGTVQDTGAAAVNIAKTGTNAQDIGTVDVDGTIDVSGGGDLNIGTLTKSGNVTVGDSSSLEVTGNATSVGSITVDGASTFDVDGTVGSAGSVLVNDGSADFSDDAAVGAVTVASGSSLAFNSASGTSGSSAVSIDNSGVLTAGDDLTVNGGMTNGGTMTTDAGTALQATGSVGNTGTLNVGGSLAADSGLSNSGSLAVDGNASSGGAVSLTGGSATFSGDLDAGGNTVTASGGTNAIGGALASADVTVENSGTSLTLAGANTIGSATVSGGELVVQNEQALAGTGNTGVSGGQVKLDQAAGMIIDELFQLAGQAGTGVQLNNVAGANTIAGASAGVELTAGGENNVISTTGGTLSIEGSGVDANLASGTRTLTLGGVAGTNTIDADSGGGLTLGGGASYSLIKDGASTWEIAGTSISNAASIETKTGTLKLSDTTQIEGTDTAIMVAAGATLDVAQANAGSGISVNDGQSLGGNGAIVGDIDMLTDSTLSPGESIGSLSFTGNLTIGGTLLVELTGIGAGSADFIDVTGLLDISEATVEFSVLSGLNDNVYLFAKYGTLTPASGPFDSIVSLPSLYEIDYNYNDSNQIALVRQTPIPIPAPIALIGVGLFGLAGAARRQRWNR